MFICSMFGGRFPTSLFLTEADKKRAHLNEEMHPFYAIRGFPRLLFYVRLTYPHNPTGRHTDIVKDQDRVDSRHMPILYKGLWDSWNIFVSP
jgi:hypothetical protein